MKKQKTIAEVIHEMCLYWNIRYDHEKKTLLHFRQLVADIHQHCLTGIKPETLMLYYHRLRSKSRGTDESVRRKFDYIKRVFKYAQARGYIKHNPCLLLLLPKCRRAPIVHLTAYEVLQLQNCHVADTRLRYALDCFLFQLETGLAYSDLLLFNRAKIQPINRKEWICGIRQKTGTEYIVPFTAAAKTIAERYNYTFARISINTYNNYLKELQRLAGVQTRLTSHLARRTFGQRMIDNGVALEVVSKMLGHHTTVMTEKHYARAGMQRVMGEVQHLAA